MVFRLILVFGILSMQLPISAMEMTHADECCDTGTSWVTQVEHQEDAPCCPDHCDHCVLPCCRGLTLAQNLSGPALIRTLSTELLALTSSVPSSIHSGGIFHPPRS